MAKAKNESEATEAVTNTSSSSVKVRKTNKTPRKILKADFQKAGVEDQDAVEFNRENNFTAEVSGAAATHLTEKDAFERVT